MEYSIKQLSALAGVSARTLRWYERVGLLIPKRLQNGYRCYCSNDVKRLQQILYYRELGFRLAEIKQMLDAPGYDFMVSLKQQLNALEEKRLRINQMIGSLRHTIDAERKGKTMNDTERFSAFKKQLVENNEIKYGSELREMFGDEQVDSSNQRLMGMSEQVYQRAADLSELINTALIEAVTAGDDARGETGRQIFALHKEWLGFYWTEYLPEMHKGLAESYVIDDRFKAYYDSAVKGAAQFLHDAIVHWA